MDGLTAHLATLSRAAEAERPTSIRALWVWRLLLLAALAALFSSGGPAARAAALVGALFACWGDRDGALPHAARWLLMTGAAVGSFVIVPRYAAATGASLGVSTLTGGALVGAGVFFGAWLAFMLSSRFWRGFTQGAPRLRAFDRAGGGLLGAIEGVLVVLTFFWTLDVFRAPLAQLRALAAERGAAAAPQAWLFEQLGGLGEAAQTDRALGPALARNPLRAMPAGENTALALSALADPDAVLAFADDPRVQEVLDHPVVAARLKPFLEDGPIRQALAKRDYLALLQAPEVHALLTDGELRDTLAAAAPQLQSAWSAARQHPPSSGASPPGVIDLSQVRLSPEQQRAAERYLLEQTVTP